MSTLENFKIIPCPPPLPSLSALQNVKDNYNQHETIILPAEKEIDLILERILEKEKLENIFFKCNVFLEPQIQVGPK